jgi:hypothetical protein
MRRTLLTSWGREKGEEGGKERRTGRPDPVTGRHASLDLNLSELDRLAELRGETGRADGRDDRPVADGVVGERHAVDRVVGRAGTVGGEVKSKAVHDLRVAVRLVREGGNEVELAVLDEGAERKDMVSMTRSSGRLGKKKTHFLGSAVVISNSPFPKPPS